MEEIIILIIQFFVEVVGQTLLELPFDMITSKTDSTSERGFKLGVSAIFVGALVGWITLWIAPHSLVKYAWLRCANLILSPLLSYAIAKNLANRRIKKGRHINPIVQARIGFLFTFSLAAIRLAYAEH